MAEALSDVPESELHTIDIDDEMAEFTSTVFENSDFAGKIHFHIGDALQVIPTIDRIFDVVFIDANKRIYSEYYNLVFDKVRSGGLIIADNTLWDGKVVQDPLPKDAQSVGIMNFNDMIASDTRVEKVILPLRDGMTLIRKKIKERINGSAGCEPSRVSRSGSQLALTLIKRIHHGDNQTK
jgi:Predicted O-methyltransferase